MTSKEELEIIETVLGGDSDAFESLVLDNQTKVYNLALKMTANSEDALDISQDVFLRAYSNLRSFRGDSRFSVWLYRMTYNLCVDFLRKKKRLPETPLIYLDEDGETHDFEIPDTRDAPEKRAIQLELRRVLDKSIDELGSIHKEILVMREVTGMNYLDIASTLNISEGTVKSRLARARKSLAEILIRKGTFPESYRQKEQEEKEVDGHD